MFCLSFVAAERDKNHAEDVGKGQKLTEEIRRSPCSSLKIYLNIALSSALSGVVFQCLLSVARAPGVGGTFATTNGRVTRTDSGDTAGMYCINIRTVHIYGTRRVGSGMWPGGRDRST